MVNETKNKKEKNLFIKDVIKSVKDFDKYEDFGLESFGKTIMYILKLVAILVLVITAISIYQFSNTANKVAQYFEENIENFEYTDGVLTINNDEETQITEFQETFGDIIVNTADLSQEQIENYLNSVEASNNMVIILKDRVMVKNKSLLKTTQTTYSDLFSGYNIGSVDKQTILSSFYKSKTQMYISISVVLCMYLLIVYFISTLFDAILLALVGLILSRLMKMKIKYSATFGMAAHAITLPVILNLLYIVINRMTRMDCSIFSSYVYRNIIYIHDNSIIYD